MIKDISITEPIIIKPYQLNNNLNKTIEQLFIKKVIHRCNDETGYIMELLNITSVKSGSIVGENSNVLFNVTGKVKTYNIEKDEIIKGIITKLDNKGISAQSGPFEVYISVIKIPSYYKFETNEKGNYYVNTNTNEKVGLNDMISIKVIGKKLSIINKMVVGTLI
jgi:DNA-directed RNA polymerase subunit E'/Rpb7